MTTGFPQTTAPVLLIRADDVASPTVDAALSLLARAGLTANVVPAGASDAGDGQPPRLRVYPQNGRGAFRVRRSGPTLDLHLPEDQPSFLEVVDEAERTLFTLPDAQRHLLASLISALLPADAVVLVVVRLASRLCRLHVREALLCAQRRFEAYGQVRFCAPDAPDSLHDLVPAERVLRSLADAPLSALATVLYVETVENVYFGGNPYTVALDLPGVAERGCPFFGLFVDHSEMRLRQMRASGLGTFVTSYGDFAFFDQKSQPQITEHHIARMALLTSKPLNRFAYGRLTTHSNEIGPLDSFGFRIGGDFQEVAEREANEIVIALYGGSGAFGWRCNHDDTFGSILEASLNRWSEEKGRGLSFRVLNFGQLGYTILEEMHSWLMFANRVRPDVVISHGGFNDLFFAPLVDPVLAERYDLVYNFNYDEVPYKPMASAIDPVRAERMVAAYMRRIVQFARLTTDGGARFIYGRQPIWIDKSLSADEQAAMAQWLSIFTKDQPLCRRAVLNMGALYQCLERGLKEFRAQIGETRNPVATVDCHRPCVSQGQDCSLFLDVAHLSGAGNRIIADRYFAQLVEWFGQV